MGRMSVDAVPSVLTRSKEHDPRVARLLEQLVSHMPPAAAQGGELSSDGEDVLIDMQVDGMRFRLVRSAMPEQEPLPFAPEDTDPVRPYPQLSPREAEIVRLVAKGLPNKAIAAVLDISAWTVATYLKRLFLKLDVASRAEMVARVLGENLLESAESGSVR